MEKYERASRGIKRLACLLLATVAAFAQSPDDASAMTSRASADRALTLIRSWVNGRYDNAAQTERASCASGSSTSRSLVPSRTLIGTSGACGS